MKNLLFVLPALLASLTTFAQDFKIPATICQDPETLASEITSCGGNSRLLDATKECLAKLDKIRRASAEAVNSKVSGLSQQGQNEIFGAGKTGYELALASHQYQLKLSEMAAYEIDGYFDHLEWPDEWDNDETLMKEPCYRDAYQGMDSLLSKLEDELDALDEKIVQDKALLGSTSTRKTGVGADSANPESSLIGKAGGKAQPDKLPVKKKSGQSPVKPNDITGTNKAIEDAKKGAATTQKK